MRSQESLSHRKSSSFKMSLCGFPPALCQNSRNTITFQSTVENLFYILHGMLCQVSHNCAVFKKPDFEHMKYMK